MRLFGSENNIESGNMIDLAWGGVDYSPIFLAPFWQSGERIAPRSALFYVGGDFEDRSIG